MTFIISIEQVVIMFLLMGVGYLCSHLKILSRDTTKDLTSLLLYVISPCLIVNAFLQKFTWMRLKYFFIVFVTVIVLFVIAIMLGKIFFTQKNVTDPQKLTVLRYSTSYSNAGFMGIPLVQAILGNLGVFFAVPYLVVFNMFMWTQGVGLFKRPKSLKYNIKSAILNPNSIASVVGLMIFVLQIPMPRLLGTALHHMTNLNTPLSMIVIGANLGVVKWSQLGNDRLVWKGVAVRNLVVPLIMLLILIWLPMNVTAMMTTLIMISCPVAGMVVLFSLLNEFELEFPTKLMCLSTVLSVITLPLIILLADILRHI
ncbi:AEC family transporter [Ligilactobacillus ceti]|uniref:AEC family transporter n=1 Tax=Ligilactobacillus ceti TaxID=395085 RepID=UPI000412B1FF|nr:AEC family transporter [Ligilactobacillus ceti]